MSEQGVDLSQIRGDWHFHMNYVSNAITQTMKRQLSSWADLKTDVSDDSIDQAVGREAEMWAEITSKVDAKGAIEIGSDLIPEFIKICRDTFPACDALVAAGDPADQKLEEFTEAARQVRGLCDDLEMMREQKPD
ncbi:MAG: hypothetical protein OER85_08550 [Gammaproteobacteria bacterium]|nr:hypothetical protein [Gammaproteobacteria bacterium]